MSQVEDDDTNDMNLLSQGNPPSSSLKNVKNIAFKPNHTGVMNKTARLHL